MSKNDDLDTQHIDSEVSKLDISKIPITTNAFRWSFSSSILYIILNIVSLLLPTVMVLTFFDFAMEQDVHNLRILLIFLDVFAWWAVYLLVCLVLSKLTLIILELLHLPQEGLFRVNKKNKDYKYFCLRTTVKKHVFWVWNNFCFPWVSNFAFKICSMRTMTADFKSTMFDGWSDTEFIQYGRNIMIGQGAVVLSSMIVRIKEEDYLIIRKVIIGDHVVLGGNSVIAPGTIIGHSCTLGVWATTHIGQVLEPNWIYVGKPAMKYKRTQTYINLKILEEAKKQAQKVIDKSKKPAIRRIVDKNEKILFDTEQFKTKSKDII
ncbi:MAG: acyltransferase [Promethearchaeota archaeon]